MNYQNKNIVKGDGGKGGSEGHTPVEDPNSLFSKGVARVLDLISEGEIVGLVDGAKSIYLDDVPIQNSDDSYNFEGIGFGFVPGLPDQDVIPGFRYTSSTTSLGVRVRQDRPVVRRVTDLNLDAVIVTLQIPALTNLKIKTGDLEGHSVLIAIDLKSDADGAGTYQAIILEEIRGKTTSPYSRDYRIELTGAGPWDVRMRRLSPDSDEDASISDQTFWSTVTDVTDQKLSYPDSAIIGLEVDSQFFGPKLPTRSYEVYGMKLLVPSNYDPDVKTYDEGSPWDGTMKTAYSNNPANLLYTALVNDRWGLGDKIDAIYADKWFLYDIAKYCDEQVDDGRGGTEARFEFNGVINSREEANLVLQAIASTFRGMVFWGSGVVTARQDSPSDPVKLVTPANVIDGVFTYTGTSKEARHSIANVRFINKEKGFKPDVLVVRDETSYARYGFNTIDLVAFGCTSPGQARRMGLWALISERLETDLVSYSAGYDHVDIEPGDLIRIADPSVSGLRQHGRLVSQTANTVTLDDPFTIEEGKSYTIHIIEKDGTVFTETITDGAGTYSVLSMAGNFNVSNEPIKDAVYIIQVDDIVSRLFRVLYVAEVEKNIYSVTALFHDPTKYSLVESGLVLDADETDIFEDIASTKVVVPPPEPLTVTYEMHSAGNTQVGNIYLDWEDSPDAHLDGYVVKYRYNNGNWEDLPFVNQSSAKISNVPMGEYFLHVRAKSKHNRFSKAIVKTINLSAINAAGKSLISNLQLEKGGTDFEDVLALIKWDASPIGDSTFTGNTNGLDEFFDGFRVRVYNAAATDVYREFIIRETQWLYTKELIKEDGKNRSFTIGVSTRSIDGSFSIELQVQFDNAAPVAPTAYTITAGVSSFTIQFDHPDEIDWVGTKVYVSESDGFTPDDGTNLVGVYQTNIFTITKDIVADTTYFVRVALTDSFDDTLSGLNLSGQIEVTPSESAAGATWGVNITGQPVDDALLNTSIVVNEFPNGVMDVQGLTDHFSGTGTPGLLTNYVVASVVATPSGFPGIIMEIWSDNGAVTVGEDFFNLADADWQEPIIGEKFTWGFYYINAEDEDVKVTLSGSGEITLVASTTAWTWVYANGTTTAESWLAQLSEVPVTYSDNAYIVGVFAIHGTLPMPSPPESWSKTVIDTDGIKRLAGWTTIPEDGSTLGSTKYADYAALRAATAGGDTIVQVAGKPDFKWDAASIELDNGWTVLIPDSVTHPDPGRWLMQLIASGAFDASWDENWVADYVPHPTSPTGTDMHAVLQAQSNWLTTQIVQDDTTTGKRQALRWVIPYHAKLTDTLKVRSGVEIDTRGVLYNHLSDTYEFMVWVMPGAQVTNLNYWARNGGGVQVGAGVEPFSKYGSGGNMGLVDGASQTGNTLVTDDWDNTAFVAADGDWIKVEDEDYMVTEDATTNASGQVTLSLHKDLVSSPLNNAAITFTGVLNDININTIRGWAVGESATGGANSPGFDQMVGIYFTGFNIEYDHIEVDGGNVGIDFNGLSDLRGGFALSVTASTAFRITSGSEQLDWGVIVCDSPNFKSFQIDSSSNFTGEIRCFFNESAFPATDNHTSGFVGDIGQYSSGDPVQHYSLKVDMVNTDGVGVKFWYTETGDVELLCSETALHTTETEPTTYVAAFDATGFSVARQATMAISIVGEGSTGVWSGSRPTDVGQLTETKGDYSVYGNTFYVDRSTARVGINESAPDYDLDVNGTLGFSPGSSVTPVDNGDVVIEATSNTLLTFKLKGSDGTVRSGTITLA